MEASVIESGLAGAVGLSAADAFTGLQPGDHLCCLYAAEAEHRSLLTAFLRAGLERGEKILYIVDAHTANPALAQMLKYESPDELIALVNRTTMAEALSAEPEAHRCLVAAATASQNRWLRTECHLRCRDGTTIVANLYLQHVPPADAELPTRLLGFVEDITDRKLTEERLQSSAALLHATEHLTRVGGWMWDVEGRHMTWTAELYQIHGFSPDEFEPGSPEHIARSLACYDECDRPVVLAAFQRCAAEGVPYDLQVPFTNARGERLWVRTTAEPVWVGGKVVSVVGNLHDITGHRRAEAALQQTLAEKEVLLREVHHRVKNNLTSILGLLELQLAAVDDPYTVGLVQEVDRRIKAMAIVHELLYQSDTLSEIDLRRYLTALVSGLPTAFGHLHGVHTDIEVAAVPMSLDTAIPCGLIVNELVTNALKHAFPEGKPRPGADKCRVVIRADWDGNYYTLQVADNGIGLPADVDWRTTRTLGLRLVVMLVQHQLQGEIELDCSSGTDFRLRFAPVGGQRR